MARPAGRRHRNGRCDGGRRNNHQRGALRALAPLAREIVANLNQVRTVDTVECDGHGRESERVENTSALPRSGASSATPFAGGYIFTDIPKLGESFWH